MTEVLVYLPNVIQGQRPVSVAWHQQWECFVYGYMLRMGAPA
jgi:hypothetical protein